MTRHERKLARNARIANAILLDEQIIADAGRRKREFERLHPVTSGAVPLVDYQPPVGRYVPARRGENALKTAGWGGLA